MNPYAQPFFPIYNTPENVPTVQSQYPLSYQLLERINNNPNRTALYEVQIGIEQLVEDGHEFDIWATAVCNRLFGADITWVEIQIVASLIIEMAIITSDTQLNFAKLCQFVDQKIPNFVTNYLLSELNAFIQTNGEYITHDQSKSLCVFLTDLYDKMKSNNGTKVPQLIELVADQLKFMLKTFPIEPVVIRNIVQVLKLSGRFLEEEKKDVLNMIFNDLNEVCCSSDNLTTNVTTQVVALIELRKNKWGVSTLHTGSSQYQPSTSSSCAPISDCEFLRICELGNDDDEIYEDYERFLQETAISAAEKALEKVSFDDEDDLLGSPSYNGNNGLHNGYYHQKPSHLPQQQQQSHPHIYQKQTKK